MASNFEECPTGILVDYIGNITVSISSDYNNKKELEDNVNEKDSVSSKPSQGAEEQSFDCQTPFVKSEAINIPNNHCLGSELIRKRDQMCFAKTEWRSPSPTTMNRITFEASRIVDQLHTTLETSLWEEEFPLSSNSEDECFEDCSNEFEESSQNETVIKFCDDTEKTPCFNKEKGYLTENPSVIDNSATEGNSGFSKISTCTGNSNANSMKESCGTTENGNEKEVETVDAEEAFTLLKGPCVAESHTTTELSDVIHRESHLILEKGKALTVESCAATEEICTFTEESSTPTEGSSTLTQEGATSIEDGSTLAKDGSTLAEEALTLIVEISTPTEEGSIPTQEGSTLIEKGSSPIDEGSTPTEEGSTLIEDSSTLIEVGCTLTDGCVQAESFGVAEEKCVVVSDSCIIVEENSTMTKEASKYEKIVIVAEDNFSEFAEFSNTDANPITNILSEEVYTNTVVEQNHKLNKITPEAKVTPLSMKSKLTKIFKTPCFKTPVKYKRLEEKENVLQECKGNFFLSERKISKIGQVPSIKGILSASNSKEAVTSISKSNIKASSKNSIGGKTLFGRENKSTIGVPKALVKENLGTPLKNMKYAVPKKTPVCKSYSVAETPTAATPIRRSSSFQTRQIPNSDQIRRERSFVAEPRPKNWNSRMSLIQTQRIGSELQTPSKIGSFLPKSSSNVFATPSKIKPCAKESQVPCPSFATPLRQTKSLDQNCSQVFGFRRPASTTSKTRFVSRLEQPSPLPKQPNGSLSRRLSPDYNTPLKRRI